MLKREARAALENICVQLEQLALATEKQEQDLRRGLRDLQEQWMHGARTSDSELRGLESRFTNAKMAVEAVLSARARAREAAVWRTLAAKERLCEELDRALLLGRGHRRRCGGARTVDRVGRAPCCMGESDDRPA